MRQILRSIWRNPGNRDKRIGKTLQAFGWQLWKRTVGAKRVIRTVNGRRFNAYGDCVVSSALIYSDWPEYHELRFIRQNLAASDSVIDVGANVGHFSLLLTDRVDPARILAFEPTPISHRRLVENWRLNGFPTDTLFAQAVGREKGVVAFPDSDKPVTTNSMETATRGAGRSIEVPVVRLDDVVPPPRISTELGLLKIDVEGFEADVFAGAKRLLSAQPPRLIMFECLGESVEPEIRETLESASYQIFSLDEKGRPNAQSLCAQNLFATRNWDGLR